MDERARLRVLAGLVLLPQLALTAWLMSTRVASFRTTPVWDYAALWAGGRLALQGRLADAYDPAIYQPIFTEATGQRSAVLWLYPPPSALLFEPFAALPYVASSALWLATGVVAVVLTAIARGGGRAVPWALLWPGTVVAIAYGQATLLLTLLLAEGLRRVEHQPVRAGLFVGGLFLKPHWMAVPLVAWALQGQWRAIAAALGVSVGLTGASLLAYGAAPWVAFRARAGETAGVIHKLGLEDAVSAYAAAPSSVGGLLQGLLIAVSLATLAHLARRRTAADLNAAGTVVALTLINPYLHFYDLVCLIVPLQVTADRLTRRGHDLLPFMSLAGAAMWGSRVSGAVFGAQVYPLFGLVALAWVVWEAEADHAAGGPRAGAAVPA